MATAARQIPAHCSPLVPPCGPLRSDSCADDILCWPADRQARPDGGDAHHLHPRVLGEHGAHGVVTVPVRLLGPTDYSDAGLCPRSASRVCASCSATRAGNVQETRRCSLVPPAQNPPPLSCGNRATPRAGHCYGCLQDEPIVVVHFGGAAPAGWTPKRFPKLVLLHMGPLPVIGLLARSFNFNKMRAMIVARIKVGVQLDADQFVAPGVDAIFDRTAQEINQEYPIPIMPSHFADRSPKDLGKYWNRYCPGDVNDRRRSCPWQTTRWGHAHPTWTYWALPFLGRWLRRNLRDETLPRRVCAGRRNPLLS